jgi:hypothetical protein
MAEPWGGSTGLAWGKGGMTPSEALDGPQAERRRDSSKALHKERTDMIVTS